MFACSTPFWKRALIPDSWTFSLLVLCAVFALLMRWIYRPRCRRYLYLAAFAYGLAVTNSQVQLAFLPAIPFFAWAGNRRVGRDFCLAGALLSLGALIAAWYPQLSPVGPRWNWHDPLFVEFGVVGSLVTVTGIFLVVRTRQAGTQWRVVLGCILVFSIGLLANLYEPVASMTNPPVNWSYPRIVPGFIHMITRGQFEALHPVETVIGFVRQLRVYGLVLVKNFCGPLVPFAFVPLCIFLRIRRRTRHWIVALVMAYLCLAFLLCAVLNPAVDRASIELNGVFCSLPQIIVALGLGYGLAIVGAFLLKRQSP